ncbi:MAG: DNA polymerase III subunit alpha [Desulfobacterales bacterium]|nr:DNA polymerase III subunit alpha [Desulfobacterales bacterium]
MIPLTIHSYYSLMWGTASPARLCAAARRMGYDRLALTDTDNLYGLWPFLAACRREGLTPVVGAELTDCVSNRRAVCLVENDRGYGNLCRLITRRHGPKPFDLANVLPDFSEGLTVLTRSAQLLERWHGAGVFVAGAAPRKPDGAALALKKTCRRLGVSLVATPGSFFVEPEDAVVHRMLRCIDRGTTLSRLAPADAAPADAFLGSPEEYARRFAPWPETVAATGALARRLTFTGPAFGLVLPPWADDKGRSPETLLREAAYAGARRRYGDLSEAVVDRLEHELRIIADMGFSSYFLVVQDIVRRSPRICGRGSGAASLVAYCLFITNVCPVRHNLYFERFLNPGRKDPPDIDVDFAWDERDAVIASVIDQYAGHAAMVCNHVTFGPRMAIREVAKVYGLPDGEIGRISKRLPWLWRTEGADADLLERMRRLPVMRGVDFPPPWPEIIALAQRIVGVPRHLSVHSGGVVITPNPLEDYVPVETAPKGVPIIQWEKEGAEAAGLVKIDLLGNRSLGVIRDAVADLGENGIDFDEGRWDPEADEKTQQQVALGRTMGCFYIESPATRLLQQKARRGDFAHVVIHSSIIRPAANAFIREYVRRLHGGAWEPIHPLLADVLDETYGIMVYQEDVSRTAQAVAGFSAAAADGLRKIMSKKDKGRRLEDYRRAFVEGAGDRGVTAEQTEAIWQMMMSFSGYSFCKPHSASYARVSFQAAYLKAHHPAAFMAAVISNQGGFYSAFAYVSEARRSGVRILPPDVNQSCIRWKGRDDAMRVGWLSLKHLGLQTQEALVQCRRQRPFRSLADLLDRVGPEDPEARALIHAGAADALHPTATRTELLWELADWQKRRKKSKARPSLFDAVSDVARPSFPPENETERLRREFAVLGFLCDRHPMALFAEAVGPLGVIKAGALAAHAGRRVRVAGLLITGKTVHTQKNEPMQFLTFEDETGLVEATFFPEAYRRFCHVLDRTRPFLLTGMVEEDFGAVTLTVSHAAPLAKSGETLRVCIPEGGEKRRAGASFSNALRRPWQSPVLTTPSSKGKTAK